MKEVLEDIKHWWGRKNLKEEKFLPLFERYEGNEVIVFDTETTGLDPKNDEMISIGALKVRDNQILFNERFDIVVKPTKMINEKSITIHHLRHCDVEHGMTPQEAVEAFIEFAGNRPLVGYYIDFDYAMINNVFKKMSGANLPNKTVEISGLYFDHKIGRIPQGNVDLRFDTILSDLGLPKLGKHDALNDAIMTALIYIKLTTRRKL